MFVPTVDDETLELGNANVVTQPWLPRMDRLFSDPHPSVLSCNLSGKRVSVQIGRAHV